MNRYLVKVALNAQAARKMARQVGVIAEPGTQWKWALRNLRDGIGRPLEGGALEKAKVGMGSLSSKGFKKVYNVQLANPRNEIGFAVNKRGNVTHHKIGGEFTINHGGLPNDSRLHRLGHTHNVHPEHSAEDVSNKFATLSGRDAVLNPSKIKKLDDARYSDYVYDTLKRDFNAGKISDTSVPKVMDKYNETIVGFRRDGKLIGPLTNRSEGRDVANQIAHPQYVTNKVLRHSLTNIVTPELGIDGVHKTVGLYNKNNGALHALKQRAVLFQR